ncbi:uncharacterized protein BDFB_008160, partial [Asbolus verrucosus]
MENSLEDGKCNKENIKELGTSQTSLKSTKSLDKSSTSGSFKNEKIHFKEENHEHDNQKVNTDASLKVPHKFIANWRQACDRTKDKTKDLLKRWRTLPEIETENAAKKPDGTVDKEEGHIESCGWSVHVWTTWVDRFSIDSEADHREDCRLTPTQNNKFSHFFTCLLDHDQDNLISEQDFETLIEFFVKVLFQVINRCGIVTRDELSAFYSSVLGLDAVKVGEILDIAYQAMTSNGDHPLMFKAYRLCFANYLLGRYPNGPGQYILGAPPNALSSAMFPVDYSALNTQPEDLEQYAPDQKTNRRSVI